MPKLPKSVVIEGRRYPTWTLSSRARDQLINLHLVDVHIAELRQRLAFYNAAFKQSQAYLRQMLSECAPPTKEAYAEGQRYFWHIVPPLGGEVNFPSQVPAISLHSIGASGYYQEGDRLLLYVKGHGVVGWGIVEAAASSEEQYLALCVEVTSLKSALPASELKSFSLRHPSRVSQRLPVSADIEGLLAKLESYTVA